jgi:hypothetical protein
MSFIALERQDLSCMYLAHHELEADSVFIFVVLLLLLLLSFHCTVDLLCLWISTLFSLLSCLPAARQVSVCLVSKSDAADQQKMLNVEAKPFVPENLKNLFEQPPTTFMSCERPLDILFSHR